MAEMPEEQAAVRRFVAAAQNFTVQRFRLQIEVAEMEARYREFLEVLGDDPEALTIVEGPMMRIWDALSRVGVREEPGNG